MTNFLSYIFIVGYEFVMAISKKDKIINVISIVQQ